MRTILKQQIYKYTYITNVVIMILYIYIYIYIYIHTHTYAWISVICEVKNSKRFWTLFDSYFYKNKTWNIYL